VTSAWKASAPTNRRFVVHGISDKDAFKLASFPVRRFRRRTKGKGSM